MKFLPSFHIRFLSALFAAITLNPRAMPAVPNETAKVVKKYCYDCHDREVQKGSLNLEALVGVRVDENGDAWEKVIRKVNSRQMPPIGKPRPNEKTYHEVIGELATALDIIAAKNPNPGRTETFRRLNRTEYQNAIRDLLGVEIDATALLPKDEASHGFDNVTVGMLSPTLLGRYITAAQKISQLAIGAPRNKPGGDTYRIPADVTQESHVEGLPLGTRGGKLIRHTFPVDGDYDFQIRLARDRNEEIEGLNGTYNLELILDQDCIQSFTVAPPVVPNDYESVDGKLKIRAPVKAGFHEVGVTFVQSSAALLERKRQPYSVAFNMHRHPRLSPAIYEVSITGPYNSTGSGDTLSRRRIFVAKPSRPSEEEPCAEKILSSLMRRAFCRPVTKEDMDLPMSYFRKARAQDGFEAGIETALSSILVSPHFLFHIEQDPDGVSPKTAYRLPDLQLASRLSFFIWSSIPDDELLDLASRSELSKPKTLAKQVKRMLADPRARSLATNFADQWLYLRNLDSLSPDARLFPDFDDNLRQAFRQETILFFESILEGDQSVLRLLKSDYTFLNDRLAKHYGITGIQGSHFRKVALKPDSKRGGLLRHGSILSVTSYATRTSPVIRGHWILGNLLGSPPPPPPADVPALKERTISSTLSGRERLGQHRANPACASCHNLMDPVGFSLENFDALGRWRDLEDGKPVDASGGFPDGSQLTGVDALEQTLLKRPDLFVGTFAEKLLTFALGRGIESYDGPAIRKIVNQTEADDFRFSSLIIAVVNSVPFKMRNSL
ncbi:MAG: DUF1592 domain-containing protein [Verrucomicrobia bacterium]|nr:DUF1592 domain-containing protein [Verrucomicrobiota bacterium]